MEQQTRLSLFDKGDHAVAGQPPESGADFVCMIERLVAAMEGIRDEQKRIADHFSPPARDVVGTDYVAAQLDCTAVWVTQMVRAGEIPVDCIVPGTGNGKPWKFRRSGIDQWLSER